MTILREPTGWSRKQKSKQWGFVLTDDERGRVRTALRVLCARHGGVDAVARSMGISPHMVDRATSRRSRPSAGLAIAVARMAEMPVEALLAGTPIPGACPLCGHVTEAP